MTPRPHDVPNPTLGTLRKYGWTTELWLATMIAQDWHCPICALPFGGTKQPVIDHHWAKGWKKFHPAERRRWIRGIPCRFCNGKYLRRGITLELVRRVVIYLERFERRRPTLPVKPPKPPSKAALKRLEKLRAAMFGEP